MNQSLPSRPYAPRCESPAHPHRDGSVTRPARLATAARRFAIAGGALAALAAVPATALAQVTLTLSAWTPAQHLLTRVQAEWCADVSKETQGRVKCNQLAKAVAPPPGTLDAVRDGLADVSFTVQGYTPGRFVLTRMVELPFIGGDSAEQTSVAYQKVHEQYFAAADEHKGVKVLAVFTHGPGSAYNTKRPITTLADFDGLKMRVGGGMINDIGAALGINMTLKPSIQSYELLSSGVMDGIFFPSESVRAFKLEKLLKYRTDFPGGFYNTSFVMVMNPATFARLSSEDQAVVNRLSGEALARRLGKAWDREDREGNAVEQTVGIQRIMADKAFVTEVRAKTDALQQQWITDAKARGVQDPAKVLQEYTSMSTK